MRLTSYRFASRPFASGNERESRDCRVDFTLDRNGRFRELIDEQNRLFVYFVNIFKYIYASLRR